MRMLSTISLIILAGIGSPVVAAAQMTLADPGRPARPATEGIPREPSRGPQKAAGDIQADFDGVDEVVSALGLDQDFGLVETSGGRMPQATVTLTRVVDESTPVLLRHHTRGTRFRDVVLTGTVGPDRTEFKMRLSDVAIEAIRLRTGRAMADEVVTLRFGKIWWSSDGNTFEWNYAKMTPR